MDGARLLAQLDRETDKVFEEARGQGEREPHERYRADALVRLVCGEGLSGPAHMVVRVDAAALRRGSLEGDEVCEVPGVGQVSVATAQSLLGEAFFNVVVTDGIDIHTVSSGKRTVPRALRVALVERDPTCVVPGCPAASHLQIDHWQIDFGKKGPTCLDNLCRLCSRHHAMKTQGGWRLVGGPGKWGWTGPLRT